MGINFFIYIALVFAFIFTFMMVLGNKVQLAIRLCIFLLPFETISKVGLGYNLMSIMGLLTGLLLHYPYFLKIKAYPVFIRIFFLLLIISFLIFTFKQPSIVDVEWENGPVGSTSFKFIIHYIVAILFFSVIVNSIKNIRDVLSYITTLILSTTYIFLNWISFIFRDLLFPFFLKYQSTKGDSIYEQFRFAGLWGDYELTAEFLFFIFVLSLLIIIHKSSQIKQKRIAWFSLVVSFIMMISTGTRSSIILFIIFFGSFLIYTILKRHTPLGTKIVLSSISIGFLITSLYVGTRYSELLGNKVLFFRFENTIELASSMPNQQRMSAFEQAINRNYSDTYLDILDVGGSFGTGPYFVQTVRGDDMVYHCLYYQLVINFGIVGLIIFIVFFVKLLRDLYKNSRKTNNLIYLFFFLLLLTLMIDQIKISFVRENTEILIYWFFFALIASVNHFPAGMVQHSKNATGSDT
jgi:hypothetical protein